VGNKLQIKVLRSVDKPGMPGQGRIISIRMRPFRQSYGDYVCRVTIFTQLGQVLVLLCGLIGVVSMHG